MDPSQSATDPVKYIIWKIYTQGLSSLTDGQILYVVIQVSVLMIGVSFLIYGMRTVQGVIDDRHRAKEWNDSELYHQDDGYRNYINKHHKGYAKHLNELQEDYSNNKIYGFYTEKYQESSKRYARSHQRKNRSYYRN